MSLYACAGIVQRGDPDRFMAVMAAPLDARRVLLPLYAFNVEVARAPWLTEEPLIAEMRLQWWWDALDEIGTGQPVRAHEVTTPLAEVLRPGEAALLQRNVDARRRDAQRLPMGDVEALRGYLAETAGTLMWAATRALSPDDAGGPKAEQRAMSVGAAQGLANYLLAVPEFLARGRNPLPEMTERAFADFLTEHVSHASPGRGTRAQRISELAAWRARGILRHALRDPAAVPEGRLEEAPILRRAGLLWRGLWL